MKVSVFVALAVLGGVGTVYAPAPTFAAVAAIFALGLWVFTRGGYPLLARTKTTEGAGKRNKPRSTLTTKLVSGYLLLWWLALIAPIAAYSPREGSSLGVTQAATQGSLQRQLLVLSFGLVGALFLPAAIKRFDPAFRWVAALWVLYLCWAVASLSWSIFPPLTLRNVIAFILVSVGSFGLGTGFYGSRHNGRDLFLRHVFAAGVLSALVVLVPLPFRWGQYDLLDPSKRLDIGGDFSTYVSRPVLCALLVFAVTWVVGVRRWQTRDWFWLAFLAFPILALKTRGPVLWAMLALGIFYFCYKVRVQDRLLQAGLLLVIGLGTYVCYSEGVFDPLVPYLTRGNVENTMELTGRVPLWEALISQVERHPWVGAGFAAFWSPDNLYRVEQLAGFSAVSAHNGFLEELLNTGAIGLAILLTFFVYAMTLVLRRARRGDPLGWLAFLFLLFYLLLNLTNALVQEFLEIPLIITLTILGLMASKPRAGPPNSREVAGITAERVASPLPSSRISSSAPSWRHAEKDLM